jgi:Ni/Co efflux regulator RcnB
MNRKSVLSAMLAVSLSSSGLAFSQDRGDRGDNSRRGEQDRRYQDAHKYDGRHDAGHRKDAREPGDRVRHDERRDGRGAGPNHAFYRGDRLPAEYRQRYYVVDDWRGHHLSAPPRGYHWVQTGADYVLVAIATGIILQLLLHS